MSQTSLPGGMPPASRDLTGRIGAAPELRWPNGAGLAVSIVVNVEEGAVGWHTRSASSVNMRRLLLEEGGFLYDSDCYDDDLPRTLPRRTWLTGCVEMVRQEPGLLRAAADPRRPAAAIAI